jgi:hypothetical protein
MPDNKVTKSGDQGGKAITINITAETREAAFKEWTSKLSELNEQENVKGFKRIEDDTQGEYKISGEVYVEEN